MDFGCEFSEMILVSLLFYFMHAPLEMIHGNFAPQAVDYQLSSSIETSQLECLHTTSRSFRMQNRFVFAQSAKG
jgi:hypothetical protein